jgi:hypothetical protein
VRGSKVPSAVTMSITIVRDDKLLRVGDIPQCFANICRLHSQGVKNDQRGEALVNTDNKEYRLLGCGAMWVYYKLTFRRNVSPPSSGFKK